MAGAWTYALQTEPAADSWSELFPSHDFAIGNINAR